MEVIATERVGGMVKEMEITTLPEVSSIETLESGRVLDIGHEKTCNCPSNHINCLTPKEWLQSQVAIWEFSYEKRDIRDKTIHPAVFPIGLPAKCIKVNFL